MVIDIGLPDGDGWSLISQIRESADNASMPIVVMTALLDSADVLNRAYDLRCEYLGKPFAAQALLAKLESARRIVDHEFADALEFASSDIPDPAAVVR
jgi:DNA-binding response OmpR family regulator